MPDSKEKMWPGELNPEEGEAQEAYEDYIDEFAPEVSSRAEEHLDEEDEAGYGDALLAQENEKEAVKKNKGFDEALGKSLERRFGVMPGQGKPKAPGPDQGEKKPLKRKEEDDGQGILDF